MKDEGKFKKQLHQDSRWIGPDTYEIEIVHFEDVEGLIDEARNEFKNQVAMRTACPEIDGYFTRIDYMKLKKWFFKWFGVGEDE
jgi:hypothetical protein